MKWPPAALQLLLSLPFWWMWNPCRPRLRSNTVPHTFVRPSLDGIWLRILTIAQKKECKRKRGFTSTKAGLVKFSGSLWVGKPD